MRTVLDVCLVLALSAGAVSADVLVVDGVGVLLDHHATIQSAVDAAAPGDVVLIDATVDTSAEAVVVDGKGLSLLTDTLDEDVEILSLQVRNLPLGQTMSVRGLRVVDAAPGEAMVFEDNAGALRLYDTYAKGIVGQIETATQNARPGGTGVLFDNCADVVLRDSGFSGGDGGSVTGPSGLDTSPGGIGGVVINSRITGFFGGFGGGRGGEITLAVTTIDGADGGTGLIATDSELFFYDTDATGGIGGDADWTEAGDGGTGFVQDGGSAIRYTWNTAASAGSGGDSTFGKDGLDGTAEVILDGATMELASAATWARDLWVDTPLREGEAVVLTGTGFDDDFWMIYGFDPAHLLLPAHEGVFTIAPPFSELIFLGHVNLFAQDFPLGPVPALPAGFDAVEVRLQAIVSVGGGELFLGPADQITLLDADL